MEFKNYFFSILIPGWNAEKYIERCVNSILENDYKNFQIILIVGGKDNSFKIAKELERKHENIIIALEQEVPHKNRALNKALQLVKGDIIIITDIDCIYQKNWLSKINKHFQNPKYKVITGPYFPYPDRNTSLAEFIRINKGEALKRFQHRKEIIGNKLCGANAAFRKEIFDKKIGRFEEESITGDDKILGMMFNKRNEKVYYFQDIYIFTELHSNNLKKYIKHQIRWERDLFINKLTLKQKFVLFLQLSAGLLKFFYPPIILLISILFFNFQYFLIFMIPWFLFYIIFIIKYYFDLKKKYKIAMSDDIDVKFDYKKAFKIVPLIFFVFGIIAIVYIAYPKRHKWYH
ncbi:MAG: glycosyltransferase [Candidatus Helarchaeota archaeon]